MPKAAPYTASNGFAVSIDQHTLLASPDARGLVASGLAMVEREAGQARPLPRLPIVLPFWATEGSDMAKSKPRYGRGKGISQIDGHVGARVRLRRTLLGMNQTKLGEELGVSFQQVQKYENGSNRISASRLYDLSRVLDVSIEHFFEDIPAEVAANSPAAQKSGKAKKPPSYEPNPMHRRETLELVRAYYEIEDAKIRKRVYELTKTLGAGAGKDS